MRRTYFRVLFFPVILLALFVYPAVSAGGDSPGVMHVHAENGDDANSGAGWDCAKRTLQAGIDAAEPGMTVLVGPGVYKPIRAANKPVRVMSLNGPLFTVINGNQQTRCATLGDTPGDRATGLIGFALVRGSATTSDPDADPRDSSGGGALGGALENCLVLFCTATRGGGVHDATLKRSVVFGNTAEYAGGASDSELAFCLLAENNAWAGEAGGASHSSLINCTVAYNSGAETGGLWHGRATYSLVQDNTVRNRLVANALGADFIDCIVEAEDENAVLMHIPLLRDEAEGDFRPVDASLCAVPGARHQAPARDLDGVVIAAGEPVYAGAYHPGRSSIAFQIPFGVIARERNSLGFMEGADGALLTAFRNNPDLSVAMLDLFLELGVNVNSLSPDGYSFLAEAAFVCRVPGVIDRLLAAGADVNVVGVYGITALHAAARGNTNPDILKLLIRAGADVEAVDESGDNAVAYAAAVNTNPAVISLLVEAGCDPNRENINGKTPLMHALERGERAEDMVAALLECGARPAKAAMDDSEETP